DRVRLDLKSASQRFFKHRSQLFGLLGEVTGSVRRVVVRFQQRCAARTERAVEDHFDRTLREMMIEGVEGDAFLQEIIRVVARTVNAIGETNLRFAVAVNFFDKIDVFLVAAGVLNLAPTESDLAIDSGK